MVFLITMSLFSFASALDVTAAGGGFNIGDWISHYLSGNTFSIVGDTQGTCGASGGTPNNAWTLQSGQTGTYSVSSCPSGHGLIDVFKTNSWTPSMEYPFSITLTCLASAAPCNIELYCCPSPEPTSQSSCSSGTFNTASCVSWNGGYQCTANGITESRIPYYNPSFNYCSAATSIICYYKDYAGTCYTRNYAGQTTCPSSYNSFPNILSCSSATPSCPSGQIVNSNGGCSVSAATASCFDSIQNQGETGIDCGGPCSACGTTPPVTPPTETGNCGNGVCSISERFLQSCIQDCSDNSLQGNVQISNLVIGDINGKQISGSLIPGQQIEISFSVTDNTNYWSSAPFLVEAGVIPTSTASNWGMIQSSGFFSLFAIVNDEKDSCCLGQSNIGDNLNTRSPWTSSTQKFNYFVTIPSNAITDKCYDNVYWDGSSSYTVYAIAKNGCYKDGYRKGVFATIPITINLNATALPVSGNTCSQDIDCSPGLSCIGGTCSGIINGTTFGTGGTQKTLTLTEYYSISDDKLITGKSTCQSTSQCSLKTDYNVSCDLSQQAQDRVTNGFDSICSQQTSLFSGGIIGIIGNLVPKILIGKDFCTLYADIRTGITNIFGVTGVCLAHSTSFWGGLWETVLVSVAAIGIPGQWVFLGAIGIIFLILFLIFQLGGRRK